MGSAPSQTWNELTGNKELHKGVEFGVKAAAEVSKDVWKRVGQDARDAFLDSTLKAPSNAPKLTDLAGPAGAWGKQIWKDYTEFPGWGQDLGRRITTIRDEVYKK